MKIHFVNKAILIFNIIIFALGIVLSYYTKIEYSIFISVHLIIIFLILKRLSSFIIQLKKIVIYIYAISFLHAFLLLSNILVLSFPNETLYSVLFTFRLSLNILIIILAFDFLYSELMSKHLVFLHLEFSIVSYIMLMLILAGIIPMQSIPLNFSILGMIKFFTNISDFSVITVISTMVLFILKYENKYNINTDISLTVGAMGISYAMSNVYFVLGEIEIYNIFIAFVILSEIFCFYQLYSLLYLPLVEISEDGDINYRISHVRETLTIKIVGFFIIALSFLSFKNLLNPSIYVYILIAVLVYLLISVQINKSILRSLLIDRVKKSSELMNEFIRRRNEDLLMTNAKLEYISTHDDTTKLPNRESFINAAENLIKVDKRPFSLVLITVHNMQTIRNLYSTDICAKLVEQFVDRLRVISSRGEFIYRISLDEYAIISLVDNEEDKVFFNHVYNSLHYLNDLEYKVDERRFSLRLKISFSRYPRDIKTLKDLFIVSDLMAFEYKKGTILDRELKNAEELMKSLVQKNMYSAYLKSADFDKEFMLYYQPQFDIKTKSLVGAEALLRWKRDENFISPAIFIPIAETSGMISRISNWVARGAVKQMNEWAEYVKDDFKIGINISPIVLENDIFLNNFVEKVNEYKNSLDDFEFEITEYSELTNSPEVLNRLKTINDMGIDLSIDDFGTGYSSLSYINMYRVQRLKIAKELVDELATSDDSILIVRAIINIAETLGMSTIAEGVEDEEQLEILKELGCDQLQGYIWGRPLPVQEFEKNFFLNRTGN